MESAIIICELENNKYFLFNLDDDKISMYDDVKVINYLLDKNIQWVQQFKPKKVASIKYGDINKYTYLAIKQFGVENVRGGDFLDVSDDNIKVQIDTYEKNNINNSDNYSDRDSDSDSDTISIDSNDTFESLKNNSSSESSSDSDDN